MHCVFPHCTMCPVLLAVKATNISNFSVVYLRGAASSGFGLSAFVRRTYQAHHTVYISHRVLEVVQIDCILHSCFTVNSLHILPCNASYIHLLGIMLWESRSATHASTFILSAYCLLAAVFAQPQLPTSQGPKLIGPKFCVCFIYSNGLTPVSPLPNIVD